MSTAPALPAERGLPTPVSNLLTSWWLAIAFAALSMILLWRDLPWGGSLFGWILLFLLLAVMAAIGTWIGWGVSAGNPSALGRCKLFSLVQYHHPLQQMPVYLAQRNDRRFQSSVI